MAQLAEAALVAEALEPDFVARAYKRSDYAFAFHTYVSSTLFQRLTAAHTAAKVASAASPAQPGGPTDALCAVPGAQNDPSRAVIIDRSPLSAMAFAMEDASARCARLSADQLSTVCTLHDRLADELRATMAHPHITVFLDTGASQTRAGAPGG